MKTSQLSLSPPPPKKKKKTIRQRCSSHPDTYDLALIISDLYITNTWLSSDFYLYNFFSSEVHRVISPSNSADSEWLFSKASLVLDLSLISVPGIYSSKLSSFRLHGIAISALPSATSDSLGISNYLLGLCLTKWRQSRKKTPPFWSFLIF